MNDADAPWQLQPVSLRTRIIMVVVCGVLVCIGMAVAMRDGQGIVLPLAVALAVVFVLDRLMQRHRVRVDASGLEVVTSVYRRRLAWAELRLEATRVIDIDEHPGRKPMFKTNAMAMPGFRGGSFRSRDMGKLFVATTGGKRLLWLPTTRGYTLLLEPRRAQALLDRLRELAPAAPRG